MIKRFYQFVDKVVSHRIVKHILFWLLSFLILVNILKVSAEIKQIDLIYTLAFHVPILFVVYLNLEVLFTIFLNKGRYLGYSFSVIVLIIVGSYFYISLFDSWIDYIFSGYYFIAYYGFWDISLYLAVYVATTSLIKMAQGWFRVEEIEKEKTLNELKALKSQINPHFLFNSLNSVYSLARKSSDQVPDTILKLSNIMRYIIYYANVEMIDLSKEINIVESYIELQKLRLSGNENVDLIIDGEIANYKIAPLLFLPFVENSFKHGLKGGGDNLYVQIKIEVTGNVVNFEIENSLGKSAEPILPQFNGIGIENVKKRLGLIYPGLHQLRISETENKFKVLLQIQLKK